MTERWLHSYVHPGTQLFSILKVEPKLTCKMKVIRANHRLKNLCSALYGVTESRAQHDLNTPDIFFIRQSIILPQWARNIGSSWLWLLIEMSTHEICIPVLNVHRKLYKLSLLLFKNYTKIWWLQLQPSFLSDSGCSSTPSHHDVLIFLPIFISAWYLEYKPYGRKGNYSIKGISESESSLNTPTKRCRSQCATVNI